MPTPPRLKLLRGLLGAVASAAVGAAAPAVEIFAFTVCRWRLQGTPAFDWHLDLIWLKRDLLGPFAGPALTNSLCR